nr:unnamed protein product [Digitaria exilis]CAB3492315.1 unnamed protein product [Digitaria exilis]CAB3502775.1 unnamed protein product [Digitaria exilis]
MMHAAMEEATTTRPPGWLILDRFVHRTTHDFAAVSDDATATATSSTCTGQPISASLRIANSPPAISRLHLHWPRRREFKRLPEPYVIAAHRHAILFKARAPFSEHDMGRDDTFFFPVDLFVYSSPSSSAPPSLHRLPPCFVGGVSAPAEDMFFTPYRNTQ